MIPVSAAESKAKQYLASMSTEDKISMMIMPVFRYSFDAEGNRTNVTEITQDIADSLKKHSFSGVILMGQNTQMYQYGHGDGYFTMVLHDTCRVGNENNPDIHMEEVDSVSITTENGLLKTTTNTGVYAYWSERQEKEWIRFRGVYTNTYDTDGIVNLSTADLSGFGIQQQAEYEVVKDNGRITEIIQYISDGEGGWSPFTKYVFEYNDTEISAERYSLMMNDIITNHGGNYYIFNWY